MNVWQGCDKKMISYALLILKQISIEIAIFFAVFIYPVQKKLAREELSDSSEPSELALSDFQNKTSSQPPLIWLQRITSVPNSEWIDSNSLFNVNHTVVTKKISVPPKSIEQKGCKATVNQSTNIELSEKERRHNPQTTNDYKEVMKTPVEKNDTFASNQTIRGKKLRNKLDILKFHKQTLDDPEPPWIPFSDAAGGDDCRIDITSSTSQFAIKKHKNPADDSHVQSGTLLCPRSINAESYLLEPNVKRRHVTSGIRDPKCSEMNSDQRQSPVNLSGLQKNLECGEHKLSNNKKQLFKDLSVEDASDSSISNSSWNAGVIETYSNMKNGTEKIDTIVKRRSNLQNVCKAEKPCKENTIEINSWPELPDDNLFEDFCKINSTISMGDHKKRRELEQTGFRWNVSRLY